MGQFKAVLSGEPTAYFVKLVPYAPKGILDSPIAEIVTLDNCTASEDELRAQFEKASSLPGCNGVASGYSLQGVNGGGKSYVAVIGWQSPEASKPANKSYIPGGAEIHHSNFNFPIKGFHGL